MDYRISEEGTFQFISGIIVVAHRMHVKKTYQNKYSKIIFLTLVLSSRKENNNMQAETIKVGNKEKCIGYIPLNLASSLHSVFH